MPEPIASEICLGERRVRPSRIGTHLTPETRAKISKATMGKSRGTGPHPTITPLGWYAQIRYLKRLFYLGTHPMKEDAQALLDAARAFADRGPSLEVFAARVNR